jgi:ATP-dependent Clp protease adaptor protein ClpS
MSTDTDITIDERIKRKLREPSKYKIIFLNDDATPMEWVIDVLTTIYRHSQKSAENITMTIHTEGSGVVGVYSHEVAEVKMHETIVASRDRGFPLNITLEEDT